MKNFQKHIIKNQIYKKKLKTKKQELKNKRYAIWFVYLNAVNCFLTLAFSLNMTLNERFKKILLFKEWTIIQLVKEHGIVVYVIKT